MDAKSVTTDDKVRVIVDALGLVPHPEGGAFAETFRSAHRSDSERGERAAATAIYFLLRAGEKSAWHRVAHDEIWLWHAGDALELTDIGPGGDCGTVVLGADIAHGQRPQHVVAAGHLQSAQAVADATCGYTLVSCVVSPGFDFEDFEIISEGEVKRQFPIVVSRSTR
jgi:predicted cupin superfamily sugar epimerase